MIFRSLFAGILTLCASTLFAAGQGPAATTVVHDQVLASPHNEENPVSKAGWNAKRTCRSADCRRRRNFSSGANKSLPGGRRYYNGRYFGNFNNRYYGPQYGYF